MFDWQRVSDICERMAEEWKDVRFRQDGLAMTALGSIGLCDSLHMFFDTKERRYIHRVIRSLPDVYLFYKWPTTAEGAKSRRNFCLAQAEESKHRIGTQVSEAWKIIRDSWKETVIYANGEVANVQGYGGLCASIKALCWDDTINVVGYYIMMDELSFLPQFKRNDFYWPRDEYGAKKRVEFCEKMMECY